MSSRWGEYLLRRPLVEAASIVLTESLPVCALRSSQDLVQAVLSQCLYVRPDVRKVKQRIEDLMKRGFIRREDPTMHTSPYVYVAEHAG